MVSNRKQRGPREEIARMAWRSGAIALLAVVSAALFLKTAGQTATASSLQDFAAEFWAWRAETQPFSRDDIPRIERPGGKRDWSRAAIEKERQQLAEFRERWKKLDESGAPAARRVDYQLMGTALERVTWELELD